MLEDVGCEKKTQSALTWPESRPASQPGVPHVSARAARNGAGRDW